MKCLTFLFPCILLLSASRCEAPESDLYTASYGKKTEPVIIFLHGGPGFNAYSFEEATAEQLADKGFRVIVYDRIGCGRSKPAHDSVSYAFEKAFDRTLTIFEEYDIEKASLIGHSFGGTLGLKFAEAFPGKVEAMLLVSAPLSYQQSFKTILSNCREVYEAKNSPQLRYIEQLEAMDTTSLEYSSYCLRHAMNCGLYEPDSITEQAQSIKNQMREGNNASLLNDNNQAPVRGFHENEGYTTMNFSNIIQKLQSQIPVYGIYGKDDGLFGKNQLNRLKGLTGEDRFTVIDNASHFVFIDQRRAFVEWVSQYLNS